MVGNSMADFQYTPNSKWTHPLYLYGDHSSLHQSSSITDISRSVKQSPSKENNAQIQSRRDGSDSDSEEDLRRTPSPGAGTKESGADLVQSPPAEGLTRPKCASSPVLSKIFNTKIYTFDIYLSTKIIFSVTRN